ncbi:MAG: hypothetical protein D3924_08045 [Candidatus Electrothrix sp. AR4]|nr:hypothetical protein [Candidatus Electrothrix sp. AR4]
MKIIGINEEYTINQSDVAFYIDKAPSQETIRILNLIHSDMGVVYNEKLHYLNMITFPNRPIDDALIEAINADIAAIEESH